MDVFQELRVPTDNVIMISFERFHTQYKALRDCFAFVRLYISSLAASQTAVWKNCNGVIIPAEVYENLVVKLRFVTNWDPVLLPPRGRCTPEAEQLLRGSLLQLPVALGLQPGAEVSRRTG